MSEFMGILMQKRDILREALADTAVELRDEDHYIEVLRLNRKKFDLIQELEKEFEWDTDAGVAEQEVATEILELLSKLIESTGGIVSAIKNDTDAVRNSMQDLSISKTVANGYLNTTQEPVFVDKDFN